MRKILASVILAALLLSAAPAVIAQTATPAPGAGDVLQTTGAMGNLNTFTSLANQAGLGDALNTGGPYTILAPSDDAFNKMPPGTLSALSNDTPRLQAVMRNHVIPGRYTANQLLDSKQITTIDGRTIQVVPRQGSVKVGDAFLTREDTPAGNNVIHVIDNVLIPS
ncbi:fasciclin domain-containing protein [Methanocella arvoryzae]|uniref:FAS1 domain-containing protein n=1 Tax=Methanocella arvoryzae (strain DSM 22066 / NBRC 105507 / MRE50) TaxID=351160 RepID=Q0W3V8_METAR|nr:fasciclin domain-containing protein [Methanocella arvoryzae]CAJ36935.1 conserved hypothetical protein [Methanocella arvoryzae MRE50]